MLSVYEKLYRIKQEGREGVLVTVVDKKGHGPASVGRKIIITSTGEKIGTVGGGEIEQVAIQVAGEVLKNKETRLVTYNLNEENKAEESESLNMVCGGKLTIFFEYIGISTPIYIFGAGHVGRALAHLLKNLDYQITLIDDKEDQLPIDPRINRESYRQFIKYEKIPTNSYIVVATSSHEADFEVLKHIYQSEWNPIYVGIIASNTKAKTLMRRLVNDIGDTTKLDSLYAPIGLDLGGTVPEEIAISIIAEIQAIKYNKTENKHLRNI